MKNKKLFTAFVFFTAILSCILGEDLTEEYFILADGFAEQKKYDKAAEFYLKAAKNPKYTNAAKYNTAKVYGLQNNWSQAAVILKELYSNAFDNKKIAAAYAYSLAASGNEQEAFKIYEQIYLTDKDNPESCFNYVCMMVALKKYDEALKLIEELQAIFIEDIDQKKLNGLKTKIEVILKAPKDKKPLEKNKKDKVDNKTNEKASNDKYIEKKAPQSTEKQKPTQKTPLP